MIKVTTYGTYDLLHYGHIRLLKRAKALGDYLIVGVTSDDFDKTRGKINVQQSLMERVAAVKATGIADEIIVEEYEGQKIDDIRRYNIDIFTVGSDWAGKFDYLNEYCKVVYLDRTQGVSSSEIREQAHTLRLGMVGDSAFLNKVFKETKYVNGVMITALCTNKIKNMEPELRSVRCTGNYDELIDNVDAVYIRSFPSDHYNQIKKALNAGKHILCESPIALNKAETEELFKIAESKNLILMEAVKTAYSTAFLRLVLLTKGGIVGDVVSVDSTCTILTLNKKNDTTDWNCIFEWGPTALLPIFQILGTKTRNHRIITHFADENSVYDDFTRMDFLFDHAVASIKIGDGVKSEGELVVSGTNGYIYVPAPWWKTEYFEVRYENQSENKRYFYQLDGEGIRYELVAFVRAIEKGYAVTNISKDITLKISDIIDDFINRRNMDILK